MALDQPGNIPAHAGRWRAGRTRVDGVVLHTSEQVPDVDPTDDAEQLAMFTATPPTATNVASYTAIVDDHRWINTVKTDDTPYAAPPCNATHLHLCFPAKAAISRDQWLAYPHRARISVAAQYIVDMHGWYHLPLKQVSAAELNRGVQGYCDHNTVRLAFGKTTHTDVGVGFPWDILAQDITLITAPPPPPANDYGLPLPDKDGLYIGDAGPEVLKLQNVIKFWWPTFYPYNTDGQFGPKTAQAVQSMQNWLNSHGYPTGTPADGRYNWMERTALINFYNAVHGIKT